MELAMGLSLALFLGAVLSVHRYVQHLPVAPACPCCNATTRELAAGLDLLRYVPHLVATSRGECTRCGWKGRMRWTWATRSVRRPPG